jgi:hypothetical protein
MSVRWDEQSYRADRDFHRVVVHHASHMLIGLQKPAENLGSIGGGWADEGLAHWFEQRYFETCGEFCGRVIGEEENPGQGRWKRYLRKQVADGKQPSAGAVMSLHTRDLQLDEHVAAFGYVDYLIALDAKLFGDVCKRLRSKLPARDALKEFFGMTPEEFQDKWKAWVLAEYPSR